MKPGELVLRVLGLIAWTVLWWGYVWFAIVPPSDQLSQAAAGFYLVAFVVIWAFLAGPMITGRGHDS